jgi:coenzyme Q-binding protein COQ10
MPRHYEKRILPYSPFQLFELVADVERYPEFLPWCLGARVRKRDGPEILADLIIGFKVFRERYTSRVHLDRDAQRIDVKYSHGPFKHLENHWIFHPHEKGCELEFYIDFEFRSKLLQKVMEGLFHEAVRRMVRAFETRAKAVYGRKCAEQA